LERGCRESVLVSVSSAFGKRKFAHAFLFLPAIFAVLIENQEMRDERLERVFFLYRQFSLLDNAILAPGITSQQS
jgi:hypothetical protein